jgi:hypothetical protein
MLAPSPLRLLLLTPILLLAPRASAAGAAVGVSGGGQLWCVAKNNAEDGALQSAIDWACSADGGRADCAAIQQGGACYDPPDLQRHASYAFNDYFLRAGGAASPAACDFSGAAALTALNPSKRPESRRRSILGFESFFSAVLFFIVGFCSFYGNVQLTVVVSVLPLGLQVMGAACFLPG